MKKDTSPKSGERGDRYFWLLENGCAQLLKYLILRLHTSATASFSSLILSWCPPSPQGGYFCTTLLEEVGTVVVGGSGGPWASCEGSKPLTPCHSFLSLSAGWTINGRLRMNFTPSGLTSCQDRRGVTGAHRFAFSASAGSLFYPQ